MNYTVAKSQDGFWTGLVADATGATITLCSEAGPFAAKRWCQHFIDTGEELPDAMDRSH